MRATPPSGSIPNRRARISVAPRIEGPWCPLCAKRFSCSSREFFLHYPACRKPPKETNIPRVKRLLRWLVADTALCEDQRLRQAIGVVLGRLQEDGKNYSEIFEPSLAYEAGRWHTVRFSYAFPAFHQEMDATRAAICRFVTPFGEKPREVAEIFLRSLENRAIGQPLLGLAYSRKRDWRIKLYLQFADEAPPERLYEKAGKLLSLREPAKLLRGRRLHMIGLDIEERGLSGAKLYVRPDLRSSDIEAMLSSPLLARILPAGFHAWNDFLLIHRLRRPDDPGGAEPVEIDFSLAPNGLHADAICRSKPLADYLAIGPWPRLKKHFALVARRFTLPLGQADRLNLYYVLGTDKIK